MKTLLKFAPLAAAGLLAACGTPPGERAVTGGLIGGGATGAVVGGAVGAGVGAATTPSHDRDYCRDHPC